MRHQTEHKSFGHPDETREFAKGMVAKPGDITSLPSGHDAWVVGDEPVVVVDWYGATDYAKASR